MQPSITIIALGVRDLQRSKKFYEALGFRLSSASQEGICFFALRNIILELFPWDKLAKDATVTAEGSGFRGVTIAQCLPSKEAVDAALQEAVAAGATVVKQPQDVFWGGYSGYFADPDGHLWELAWNPFIELSENGTVALP